MTAPCRLSNIMAARSLFVTWSAALLAACRAAPAIVEERTEWAAPADDPTPVCADVSDVRVCWGTKGTTGCSTIPCVRPRPVPPFEASPLGFRCTGNGKERRCVERRRDVPGFSKRGAAFVEPYPRLPDDGEWECTESAGATVCRGGALAAGVLRGAPDRAFFCGEHRVRGTPTGEKLCVDLSPDFPAGTPLATSCRFESRPLPARVCEPNPDARVLGDPCDRQRPCVDGALCATGRCVPPRPDPSCWLDSDCTSGACRFGTCTEAAP